MASEPRLTPPPPAHVGFVDDTPVAQAMAGLPGTLPGLPGTPAARAPAAAPAPAAAAPGADTA